MPVDRVVLDLQKPDRRAASFVV